MWVATSEMKLLRDLDIITRSQFNRSVLDSVLRVFVIKMAHLPVFVDVGSI